MIPPTVLQVSPREEEGGGGIIWGPMYNWIISHPQELFLIVGISLIFYQVWKWASKYWFHELFLHKEKERKDRYLGRIMWIKALVRDKAGKARCDACEVTYGFYPGEEDKVKCTNCGNEELDVILGPQEDMDYYIVKICEQFLPWFWKPRFKIITFEKEKTSYYKKGFMPLENFPKNKQKRYQRMGVNGRNAYWNKEWSVYEIEDEYIKSRKWQDHQFVDAAVKLYKDSDRLVRGCMNVNPAVISQHIDDINVPMPPDRD